MNWFNQDDKHQIFDHHFCFSCILTITWSKWKSCLFENSTTSYINTTMVNDDPIRHQLFYYDSAYYLKVSIGTPNKKSSCKLILGVHHHGLFVQIIQFQIKSLVCLIHQYHPHIKVFSAIHHYVHMTWILGHHVIWIIQLHVIFS
jgi:hypothetical protein